MNTRDQIQRGLEAAALGAGDKVDELLRLVANETDPDRRRVLQLKLQAAATERDDLLQALFATPRTLR